jgi:hypothetical protein
MAKERAGTGLDHSATWQRAFKVILTNKSIGGPVWSRLESSEWALSDRLRIVCLLHLDTAYVWLVSTL